MRVAVGSTNPVKRGATEDTLASLAGTSVEAVAVDPGVSEQPTGHPETVASAENRARRALESGAYDLGIGIEGGGAEFDGAEGLYLHQRESPALQGGRESRPLGATTAAGGWPDIPSEDA